MINLPKELLELRKMILTMGAAVEQSMHYTAQALFTHDAELAMQVRRQDKQIDHMELDIEEECLRILALSQPVASDLRFVLAVMRINTNFERVADMAKSICKRILAIDKSRWIKLPPALEVMTKQAQSILSDTLKALADQDAELARQIRANDDQIDDLLKEIFAWVQEEIPSHIEHTEAAIDFLSIARKLERIADVCTNIAADVIFLSEGHLVRHSDGKNAPKNPPA